MTEPFQGAASPPIKTLFLRTMRGLKAPSGAEINLANLARLLPDHGVEPHFLVTVDPNRDHSRCLDLLRSSGATVDTCAVSSAAAFDDLRAARAAIARLQPDIVHTIDHRSDTIGALLRLRGQRPVVATFHGWTNWQPGSMRWRVYGTLDRLALSRLDRVIYDSHRMIADSLGRVARAPHLRFVPNGINIDAFAGAAGRALCASGPPTFLQISRFHPNKGQLDLVRAAAQLAEQGRDDLRFVLVGDAAPDYADYEAEVRGFVSEKDLTNVEFLGAVPHSALCGIVAEADVLVAPSEVDGVSLAVLEAMSAGRAVICYAAAGFADSFTNDETAVILEKGNAGSLSQAMLSLADDPARAQRIGAAASAFVRAEHSSTVMTGRVVKVYREALAAAA